MPRKDETHGRIYGEMCKTLVLSFIVTEGKPPKLVLATERRDFV